MSGTVDVDIGGDLCGNVMSIIFRKRIYKSGINMYKFNFYIKINLKRFAAVYMRIAYEIRFKIVSVLKCRARVF